MKKEKLSKIATDPKENDVFSVKAEYVSTVWNLIGERLKFVYDTEKELLTVLWFIEKEPNNEEVYVLYKEIETIEDNG